ncbi:MAG: hypothetical protein QM820_60445 [Minicystis sp.]
MEPRGTIYRLITGGLWALAALGLVIGAATARVVSSGEKEIALSTAGLRAGDAHAAAEHARRAAGWYAPGAPHVRVAYERLIALGTAAEGLGDRELALFAFRGVRTAALETRWIVIPHEDDLEKANLAIARLSAEAPRAPGLRTEPPQKIEREQLEALARDEAPRTAWVVVLVAGALAWAVGAFGVVRRGVTRDGAILWSRALPSAVIAAAGVLAWLLAIWRA